MPEKPLSHSDPSGRVSELGEFGLIDRLAERLGPPAGWAASNLVVGIGDDAAVWRTGPGALQVAHTDALIAGVHFDRSTTTWYDLGWKAIAVNLSDLAAMAAEPRYLLVVLTLADNPRISEIDELYGGMRACAEQFGACLVGGDTSAGPVTFLAITAIGESTGPLLLRSNGRAGDLLAVTGALGGSRGGLRLLQGETAADSADAAELMRIHQRPWPRVAEGLCLARAGVRCGLDVSDGLVGDARHVCERSGLGAILHLDRVPAPPALKRLFPDDWRELALAGGEDYELLVAAPDDVLKRASDELLATTGTPLTIVGELVEAMANGQKVRVVDESGHPVKSHLSSWEHFR